MTGPLPDGRGRVRDFDNGSIYWSPETGAHEVHGAIRDKWQSMGWERSKLRYPTTDERDIPGGRASTFQAARSGGPKRAAPSRAQVAETGRLELVRLVEVAIAMTPRAAPLSPCRGLGGLE